MKEIARNFFLAYVTWEESYDLHVANKRWKGVDRGYKIRGYGNGTRPKGSRGCKMAEASAHRRRTVGMGRCFRPNKQRTKCWRSRVTPAQSWFLCPDCRRHWQLLPQGCDYLPAGKGQHYVGAQYKECPHCREKAESKHAPSTDISAKDAAEDQHPEKEKTASSRRTPYKPNC